MPRFVAEIEETTHNIVRPVIYQIINDYLSHFKGLPFREIRFPGETDQLTTPTSTIDATRFNRSLADNYIDVEIEDTSDEDFDPSYNYQTAQNKKIISCKRLGLDMYPIYQNRVMTISLNITSSSRVRMNKIISRIKAAMHSSDVLLTHQISYDYELPQPCNFLLMDMFALMENNHGYGWKYVDWIESIKEPQVQFSARIDGQLPILGVRENGVNILTNLVDASREPRKEKSDDVGGWKATIEIEMRYQRPNEIRVSYPPIVHNQLLEDYWFNSKPEYTYRRYGATSSIAGLAGEYWKWNLGWGVPGASGIGYHEPSFDDWQVITHEPNLHHLLTCLIAVDEGDRKAIFDIPNDIVEHKFNDVVLDMLRVDPRSLFYPGKNIISAYVHNWNKEISLEYLEIDKDLNIRCAYDLNPRDYHHITFYLNTDPTTIHNSIWEDLRCKKESLEFYFGMFGDKYRWIITKMYADNNGEKCLTVDSIREVIREIIIDGKGEHFGNSAEYYQTQPRRDKLHWYVLGYKPNNQHKDERLSFWEEKWRELNTGNT